MLHGQRGDRLHHIHGRINGVDVVELRFIVPTFTIAILSHCARQFCHSETSLACSITLHHPPDFVPCPISQFRECSQIVTFLL
jgi:hypothetical protein